MTSASSSPPLSHTLCSRYSQLLPNSKQTSTSVSRPMHMLSLLLGIPSSPYSSSKIPSHAQEARGRVDPSLHWAPTLHLCCWTPHLGCDIIICSCVSFQTSGLDPWRLSLCLSKFHGVSTMWDTEFMLLRRDMDYSVPLYFSLDYFAFLFSVGSCVFLILKPACLSFPWRAVLKLLGPAFSACRGSWVLRVTINDWLRGCETPDPNGSIHGLLYIVPKVPLED